MENYLDLLKSVIVKGPYADSWESLCSYGEPAFYQDLKFGIFIHWGVYCVPAFANEWYSRNMYIQDSPEFRHHVEKYGAHKDFGYKDFIPLFKGENFDADEWMSLIADSGAQYVMPVAEHHDGFAMYDSALTPYAAARMGPCRDVLSELKRAAEKKGLVFSLSYHRAEHCWFFNGGLEFDSDVRREQESLCSAPASCEAVASSCGTAASSCEAVPPFYGKQQAGGGQAAHEIDECPPTREHCEDWLCRMVELVEKYRPSIVYFDWWVHNLGFRPYLKKFAAYYYNRALELGFPAAINYKHYAFPPGAAILDVERGRLDEMRQRMWQGCTATAHNSWCHTESNHYKDPADIICALVDSVSKNGRLLLNIGPRADGTIVDEDVNILRCIGRWLGQNGEGIYGTSCWELFGEGAKTATGGEMHSDGSAAYTSEDIRFTYKGGNIYAFVMKYPDGGGEIGIKSLKKINKPPYSGGDFEIAKVTVLGSAAPATFRRDETALHVSLKGIEQTPYPVGLKISLS